MSEKIKSKLEQIEFNPKVVGAVGFMLGASPLYATEGSSSSSVGTIDWTTIDLTSISSNITTAIPKVLPIVIGLMAIRKGISFVKGMLGRA